MQALSPEIDHKIVLFLPYCSASTQTETQTRQVVQRIVTSEKIKPHHLERKAILYVCQSSAYQVAHNLESRASSIRCKNTFIS
jgi:hypothetical protein